MGRFNSEGAKDFSISYNKTPWGNYWRMYWTVDRYYAGSRLRFPTGYSRDTDDEKAARRFCTKHNIKFPEPEE